MKTKLPIRIVLDEERPVSWNTMYQGQHWAKRNDLAREKHFLMHMILNNMGYRIQKSLLDVPVDITVTAYFKNRPLDADNITSKIYLDGLKDILLRDDTHEYVSSVTTQSRIDKVNPRVEILITESGVVNRTI